MQRHIDHPGRLRLLSPARPWRSRRRTAPIRPGRKAIEDSWATAAPDWQARLVQDETQKACSQYRNSPPKEVAEAIVAREQAAIVYPADGKLMGDWKNGEKLARAATAAGSPTIRRGRPTAATAMPATSWPRRR